MCKVFANLYAEKKEIMFDLMVLIIHSCYTFIIFFFLFFCFFFVQCVLHRASEYSIFTNRTFPGRIQIETEEWTERMRENDVLCSRLCRCFSFFRCKERRRNFPQAFRHRDEKCVRTSFTCLISFSMFSLNIW